MKPKKFILTAVLLSATGFHLIAQRGVTQTTLVIKEKKTATQIETRKESAPNANHNFLKFNLTGVTVKNYSVQFERTLNNKFSAALAMRLMPNTALPFRSQISKSVEGYSTTKNLIDNLELSNFTVTPELRMYLGKKGYGHGFYVAPFYRLALFNTNSLNVSFTGESGEDKNLTLSGNLNTNTVGILFGAQWALGRRLCLDWSIAGPHYGTATGNFKGIANKALTQAEQVELSNQLNKLDIPMTEKIVNVDANGGTMTLDGPWGGVRAALSLGVKF